MILQCHKTGSDANITSFLTYAALNSTATVSNRMMSLEVWFHYLYITIVFENSRNCWSWETDD